MAGRIEYRCERRSPVLKRLELTASILAMSVCLPAHAQDQADQAIRGSVFSQEDIVVTATRRSENLNRVPVSITAVSAAQVDALGADNVTDIQQITPNFSVQSVGTRPNDPILAIRGLLKRDGDATLDTAVGVYSDDVFLARGYSVMGQLLDVERIEVLRGPQGTLFGRNTIGGAIQVISRKPKVGGGTDGYVEATAGNYGLVKLGGAATVQLFDGAAFRIAGKFNRHSGYTTSYLVDDTGPTGYTTGAPILDKIDTNDANDWAVRGSFAWEVGPDTSIDLSGYHSASRTNGVLSRGVMGDLGVLTPTYFNSPTLCLPGGCGIAAGYSEYAQGNFYKGLTDVRPDADSKVGIYVGKIQHEFGDVTAKFIASLADAKTDSALNVDGVVGFGTPLVITGIPLPPVLTGREPVAYAEGDVTQKTLELQFSGKSFDRLEWIVGLYYFHEKADDFNFLANSNIVPTGAPFTIVDVTATNISKSVYGSLKYALTDRLKFRVGGRYTSDNKGFAGRSRNYSPANGIASCAYDPTIIFPSGVTTDSPVDAACSLRNKQKSNHFTWDASLEFQAADKTFLYAKVGTGYRTGGISLNANSPLTAVPFKQDSVTSYELGIKTDVGALGHINATVFYTDYKDVQQNVVTSQIPSYGLDCAPGYVGAPIVITCNFGDAKVKGVEVDAVVYVTKGFSILGTYGYTDLNFDNSQVYPVFIPKQSFSASASYEMNIGNIPVNPVLSYSHSSSRFTGITAGGVPRDFSRLKGYSLLNARLNVELTDSLTVAFWGRNLTKNKYYGSGVSANSPLYQVSSGVPGDPRTFGVDAKFTF